MKKTSLSIPTAVQHIWDKLPRKREIIVDAILRHEKLKLVNVLLPEETYKEIRSLAADKEQDIDEFITEHICYLLHGHAIRCPECNKPQFLEYEMPVVGGDITIVCKYCGHEWIIKED